MKVDIALSLIVCDNASAMLPHFHERFNSVIKRTLKYVHMAPFAFILVLTTPVARRCWCIKCNELLFTDCERATSPLSR